MSVYNLRPYSLPFLMAQIFFLPLSLLETSHCCNVGRLYRGTCLMGSAAQVPCYHRQGIELSLKIN